MGFLAMDEHSLELFAVPYFIMSFIDLKLHAIVNWMEDALFVSLSNQLVSTGQTSCHNMLFYSCKLIQPLTCNS